MKKLLTILASVMVLFSYTNLKAEVVLGITGAAHFLDVSGTETLRNSGKKTNKDNSEEAMIPEVFAEAITDNGIGIGIAYVPTRELGSKSRSDSNAAGDTGTYKAAAELNDVVQIYVDVPFAQVAANDVYVKLGVQHVTVKTLENLNSGSVYPDKDLLGLTIGLGTKGDLPFASGLIYKIDATYTDFEDYNANDTSNTGNSIKADLDASAIKFSIGKTF